MKVSPLPLFLSLLRTMAGFNPTGIPLGTEKKTNFYSVNPRHCQPNQRGVCGCYQSCTPGSDSEDFL